MFINEGGLEGIGLRDEEEGVFRVIGEGVVKGVVMMEGGGLEGVNLEIKRFEGVMERLKPIVFY